MCYAKFTKMAIYWVASYGDGVIAITNHTASLAVAPLVENAVKHGVTQKQRSGDVAVSQKVAHEPLKIQILHSYRLKLL